MTAREIPAQSSVLMPVPARRDSGRKALPSAGNRKARNESSGIFRSNAAEASPEGESPLRGVTGASGSCPARGTGAGPPWAGETPEVSAAEPTPLQWGQRTLTLPPEGMRVSSTLISPLQWEHRITMATTNLCGSPTGGLHNYGSCFKKRPRHPELLSHRCWRVNQREAVPVGTEARVPSGSGPGKGACRRQRLPE